MSNTVLEWVQRLSVAVDEVRALKGTAQVAAAW
jgi:hypothetical protein